MSHRQCVSLPLSPLVSFSLHSLREATGQNCCTQSLSDVSTYLKSRRLFFISLFFRSNIKKKFATLYRMIWEKVCHLYAKRFLSLHWNLEAKGSVLRGDMKKGFKPCLYVPICFFHLFLYTDPFSCRFIWRERVLHRERHGKSHEREREIKKELERVRDYC